MFLKNLWFVVVSSTLLLQRCIADEALSTIKTSSGRSSYLNAGSKNSNIEITPNSSFKSDSSFSASQSELSQNDSSVISTADGDSLQDSSYYSSNSNISGSSSSIFASDGSISQAESNFAAASSSTSESDSSFIATPNGSISSKTTSSSTSTLSSSSTTSRSANGQFLDDTEADINFPDDFPHINSSYETKSLDSTPGFSSNSPNSKTVPGSSNSKFSPSSDFKPISGPSNSKNSPGFSMFPNSTPDFFNTKPFPGSANSNFSPSSDFKQISGPPNSKNLSSFPMFPNSTPNFFNSKPFPGSPNSNFSPLSDFKQTGPLNSKNSPSFPMFPNSLPNDSNKKTGPISPYSPAGLFNSKPSPKIGTPVGPADKSTSFSPKSNEELWNNLRTAESFPSFSNPAINGPLSSDSLSISPLQNDNYQKPSNSGVQTTISDSPLDSPANNPLFNNNQLQSHLDNLNNNAPYPNKLANDMNSITNPYPGASTTFLDDDLIPNDISSSTYSPTMKNHLIDHPTFDDSTSPINNDHVPYSGAPNSLDHDQIQDGISSPTYSPIIDHPSFDTNLNIYDSGSTDTTPTSQNEHVDVNHIPLGDSLHHYPTSLDSTSFLDDNKIERPLQPLRPDHSLINYPESNILMEEFLTDKLSSQVPKSPNSSEDMYPFSPYDSLTPHSKTDVLKSPNSSEEDHLFAPNGSLIPHSGNDNPDGIDTPIMGDEITSPYDSISHDLIDTNSPFAQFQSHQPHNILKELPATTNDVPTPTSPYYDSDSNSGDIIPHQYPSPARLESMDVNEDGYISSKEMLEAVPTTSNNISTLQSPYDSNLYSGDITSDQYSSPAGLESMDVNQDGYISSKEMLETMPTISNNIPIPKTPYDSNLYAGDITPDQYSSPGGLESMDVNQDGYISSKEMLDADNDSLGTLNLPYSNQNGLISPNMSELNTPSLDNINQPNLSDSPYYPAQPKYGSSINLSETNVPHDQLSHIPQRQPLSYLPNSRYNPQQPNFGPYGQLLGPPQNNLYFNSPSPSGYPPRYPPVFPNENMPYSRTSSSFHPPSPYFRNGYSNYLPPYGSPMMPTPSIFDYERSFLKQSPWSNYPLTPNAYNKLPPLLPKTPFSNKPMYPHPGPPFYTNQRPYYVPKNWSKIPSLDKAHLPSLSDSTPLSVLPTDLDTIPGTQSSGNQQPLLYDSFTTDSPLVQPTTSLDSNNDSLFAMPNSSSSSLLKNGSPSTSMDSLLPGPLDVTNSFYPIPNSPLYSPLEFDKTLPQTTQNSQSTSPFSIDDEMFKFLKDQYESTIAKYQLSNSIYPRDIATEFSTMTEEELTFNFVILGSSPAVLSALKTLSNMGKSILVIERGRLPPYISKSLYYRPKMLQSEYVRQIKSSAPHCNVEKILYAPNVLGDESTYDSNVWDYGVRSKYIKWGKLCKKWTWNNVIEYFTDALNNLSSCAVPVSTDIENTKAVATIANIFNDAGLYRTDYQKGKRLEGLTVIPYLQENEENIILAEYTFQQLTSFNNIQLALQTTPETIVFDSVGKAIGVTIKTPCGKTKTISIIDELIIGTNPIDTVQFLYQSGIGDHEKLQQLNVPTQINLPYVGKELIITPSHFGVIYLFPQGTLLSNQESDLAGVEYLFGKYGLPSALAVDYFKAALNIYESHEANVIFNFRVFSKSMSERFNSFIERLRHIDEKIKDFLIELCQEYDLLLAIPQLTNVLSRGEIIIDNSSGQFEALVDTGMYKSKRDIAIMQKALKVLKSLAETETFKSMNGKVVQIPIEQCGTPDFSTEYNRCSIQYLSLPNLHYSGGTIMGVDPLTSVVNEDLLVHGTSNVRIYSTSVVPYGTSTDSSAVSSMIGNLAAHILLQNYSP